jgi:hypothetical protein
MSKLKKPSQRPERAPREVKTSESAQDKRRRILDHNGPAINAAYRRAIEHGMHQHLMIC